MLVFANYERNRETQRRKQNNLKGRKAPKLRMYLENVLLLPYYLYSYQRRVAVKYWYVKKADGG